MKKIFSYGRVLTTVTLLLIFSLLTQPALAQDASPSLPNPLQTQEGQNVNVITILLRIIQIALAVVDIFALFMFILGGFEFLVSAGNPTLVKKAKDTLIWATLGIIVITLSYSILKFIFENVAGK